MLLNCGVGEDSLESLGLQGDPTSPSSRKSVLNIQWKDWCWSWNSNTLATWCKELNHLKRPWCWERLKGRGEEDNSGWDGWMASLTQWTWICVNSRSWWWTGRPGMLQSRGSQGVGHNWATKLNWTIIVASLVAQWSKISPPMQETRVWSPGQEHPLEKEIATHPSIPAWRIQLYGQKSLAGYSPKGCKRAGRDLVTKQQLEHLEGSDEIIHILLLAHIQAHGSLSINIYCLSPSQIIYFTLSTSSPKLTIAVTPL